jgi:hypothetical protein
MMAMQMQLTARVTGLPVVEHGHVRLSGRPVLGVGLLPGPTERPNATVRVTRR